MNLYFFFPASSFSYYNNSSSCSLQTLGMLMTPVSVALRKRSLKIESGLIFLDLLPVEKLPMYGGMSQNDDDTEVQERL